MLIQQFDFFPDAPGAFVADVGPLASGAISIELWLNAVDFADIESSGCARIGDTDFYTWPISNINSLPLHYSQFHWRMSGSGVPTSGVENEAIIVSREGRKGIMPDKDDTNAYIVQN